jgi:hypothetical protein
VASDYDDEKRTVPGSRDFAANGIFREINVDTVQGMQVGENNIQIINNYASPKVTLAACRELVKEVFGLRACVQDLTQYRGSNMTERLEELRARVARVRFQAFNATLEVPSLAEQAEELSAAASLLGDYTVSQIDINFGCVISPSDLTRLDDSVESFSRSASLAGDTGTERRRLLKWQRTGNASRSR